MQNFELAPIPSQLVPVAWEQTAPFVDQIVAQAMGESTAQTIFEDLLCENKQLWHIVSNSDELRAVWITQIYTTRSGLKILNWFGCAGEGANEWLPLREQIEQWAVEEHGVSVAKIIGRKGWERKLPDYKPAYVGFVKPLGPGHEQRQPTCHDDDNQHAVETDATTPEKYSE